MNRNMDGQIDRKILWTVRQADRQTEVGVVAKCATILHQHSVCVATVISPILRLEFVIF